MTLFEHHTTDELIDLVNAKDGDLTVLAGMRASHPQIAASDPSWDADYARLRSRWDPAKKMADAMIQIARVNITTPNSLLPAEDAYQGIVRAISPVANTITPDSLAGLTGRMMKIGARPPEGYQTPQPKSDGLRSANAAVKTIQDVARAPFEGLAQAAHDAAEGGTKAAGKIAAAIPKGIGDGIGDAMGVPWWVVAIVVLGGTGVVLYLLYRAAPMALRVAEVATPQGRVVGALRAANAAMGTSPSPFQQRVRELQAAG